MIDYNTVQKIQDLAERIPRDILQDLIVYTGKEYSYNYNGYGISTDLDREDFIEYLSEIYPYTDSTVSHAVDYYLQIMDLFDPDTMMYDKYLQLSDNSTLNQVDSNIDLDLYYDIVVEYMQKFENVTGSDLYAFGRNNRHICVRFNAKNLQEYYDLCMTQQKLEAELIDVVNDNYSYATIGESRKIRKSKRVKESLSKEKEEIFYNTLDEIQRLFDNAGIWYDVYSTDYYHDVISYGNHYEIDIEIDGDWKHDHLYADKLVKDRFGDSLVDINEYESDEDDINGITGDTYKSVHEYRFRY